MVSIDTFVYFEGYRCKKSIRKAYRLVCLPREGNLLAVLHSLLDHNLEDLLLLNDLLALALRASIFLTYGLPSALALVARVLHLLNHAHPQLADSDLHTRTSAAGAFHGSPRFRALTAISIGRS